MISHRIAIPACLAGAVWMFGGMPCLAEGPVPGLPRSTPEAQGISSAAVRAFVEAADKEITTMHGLVIVRHGHVVAEGWWKPQTAETSHIMNSLSKSFTSTAVGLAIEEGKLSLDDEVLKFFPDQAPPEPSKNLRAMRIRDLLTMSTGHDTEPKFVPEIPWTQTFLAHPVPYKPGTHFKYNSPATYMLSAIVQKVTGKPLLEYLKPRLFDPLGIDKPTWGTSPQGVNFGGWGLYIRTEDIAKFGQLYLRQGKWNGKQLVPAAWVQAATSKQTSNGSSPSSDWDQGYGFQFWRCRHGAYRGDGAAGQFCIVLPEQDAVVAITADTRDMQGQLNVVWNKLLPAFGKAPLPEDRPEQEKLAAVLGNLTAKETPPKPAPAPTGHAEGTTLDDETLTSAILKKDMKYSVYLPAGYETSDKHYPILYLLHGGGDDHKSWFVKGNAKALLDAAIRAGHIEPLVVVMPAAERTYYLNHFRGEYQYEDYFFKELLPHVEKTYRVKAEKKYRSVAGLSMGGFGSLVYSLKHPELFGTCCAFSSGVRTDEEFATLSADEIRKRYVTVLGNITEVNDEVRDFLKSNSPLHLIPRIPAERKTAVRLFLDCGDDDFLYAGNAELHVALRKAGIPHEFRVRDGAHNWDYWQASLPEALKFISRGMK